MDKVSASVKEMYEKYPYPSGAPQVRVGNDVRLLLSYVDQSREKPGPLYALDAGCGRGLGVIGAAMLQQDINFIAIDINTVGIRDAQQNAADRNIENVQFQQVNLMTLEGLEVPPGGFDVIYSSGVLHHLADPLAGLKKLESVLAPHGVIFLMVYGYYGRQPLNRLIDAIDLVVAKDQPIENRIAPGRVLASTADKTIFKGNYWQDTSSKVDVEFVDRCLNVNETSYDVDGLMRIIDDAELKFLRWQEPADWSVDKLFEDEKIKQDIKSLSEFDQYKVIERLFERPKLELVICKKSNQKRSYINLREIESEVFVLNPEISISVEKRNLRGSQRIEDLRYKLRARNVVSVPKGLLAETMLLISDQTTPFTGEDLILEFAKYNVPRSDVVKTILELVEMEIIYRPHPTEAV